MGGFTFAEFEIDLDRRELRRAGQPVAIRPRIFALLVHLVRHAHRPVAREELLRQVWGARVLSESSIPTAINELRRVVDDNPAEPFLIQTVPRAGYRFAAGATPCFPAPTSSSFPFVGRKPEIARLQAVFKRAVQGSPQCVLICGDAGIGKTALAEEFSRYQSRQPVVVLTARCRADLGAPPFSPWIDLIRTWTGKGTGAVGDQLAARLTEGTEGSDLVQWESRYSLFRSLASVLAEASCLAPLLILLDDLHVADVPSLQFLEFALRDLSEHPIMVVATYRDAEPHRSTAHAELLGRICSAATCHSVELAGLPDDDVRELLTIRSPGGVGDAEFRDLCARTAGNPLFVTHLADFLPTTSGGTSANIPRNLKETLNLQLRALPQETRDLLKRASVLGATFDLAVLSAMAGLSTSESLARLEAAVRRRLIHRDSEMCFAFAHGLLREATYDLVDIGTRSAHHRAAGVAIERLSSSIEKSAAEIAYHFERGLESKGTTFYSVLAGRWCFSRTAYDEAADHFRRALSSLTAPEPAEQRSSLLIELGESELRAGKRRDATETFLRAADLAKATRQPRALAHAALALAPNVLGIEAGIVDPNLIRLLEDAIDLVPRDDGILRSRLLARLSIALVWAGSQTRRAQLVDQALILARETHDDRALAESLIAHYTLLSAPTRISQRIGLLRQLREATERAQISEERLLCSVFEIGTLLELADISRLDLEIDRFSTLAQRLSQPHFLWYVHLFGAMRDLLEGRFEAASEGADRMLQMGSQVEDANLLNCFGCHTVAQLWEADRTLEAIAVIDSFLDRFPRFDAWRATRAFLRTEAQQLDLARAEYQSLARDGFGSLIQHENWRLALSLLARCATRLKDRQGAERLFELLSPGAGTMVIIGYGVMCWGPQDRELALLADFLGSPDLAESYFRSAKELSESAGAFPALAQTHLDHANSLAQRNSSDDRDRAARFFGLAGQLASTHGMARLSRESSTGLTGLGLCSTSPPPRAR